MLHLEFTQIEEQKENLKKDNATLVQRWIDKQNAIGDMLNERNEQWYEDLHSKQTSDMPGNSMHRRPSQESLASSISFVSGNGSRPFQTPVGREQDLQGASQTAKGGLLLSPNG